VLRIRPLARREPLKFRGFGLDTSLNIEHKGCASVNRVVARICALALLPIGVVAFAAGSVGAGVSRQDIHLPKQVTVYFEVKGDLASLQGYLHDFNCVDRVQPNPFVVSAGQKFTVDVFSFVTGGCAVSGKQEAIWLLTTRPKSANDAPETMGVRLRYGYRPTEVAFLHTSRDLRWESHVLDRTHVVVTITGK
jgi:hypothetical protein